MQQVYWTSRTCASGDKSWTPSGRRRVVMTEKKGFTGFGSLKANLVAIVAFLLFTAGAQIFFTVQAISDLRGLPRSEEHTSELQSLMRISYAVFCLKIHNTSS